MAKVADPALEHIAPDLRPLAVPLTMLKPWPGNPRHGNVALIAESLKEFGQVRPLVVQSSTSQVVAGNHVFMAAHELGWTQIAAVFEDLNEAEAGAYLLADNRLSDLASYDTPALVSLLQQISSDDGLLATGFTQSDLMALMAGQELVLDDSLPDEGHREEFGPALKQVVLLIPEEDAAEMMRSVQMLRERWNTASTVATIIRAVEDQAKLLR